MCSSDLNTVKILDKYVKKDLRFKYYNCPETYSKGGNGARNYGFTLSKGYYINWFDDADVMLNNFLMTMIENFASNTSFFIDLKIVW